MGDLSIDILTQPSINFLLPNMSSGEWRSTSDFPTAGMELVYEVANLTLNSIFPPYEQYLGYASKYEVGYDQLLNITKGEWERLVVENKGPLGFIIGCLLFILILSLWGVGWVLSKCCCGDKGCCLRCLRSKSDDLVSAKLEQKRDKCKRNFCGILFATIIVVFMFGLVCCFVTNEQMRMSVERMPGEVDNSLQDVETYLGLTERQINATFIDNYKLLASTLNHILDQSGEIIKEGLSKRTGAQMLDNLTKIVDTVKEVKDNVIIVEKSSKGLREMVERLKNGLIDSKTRLLGLLAKCQSQKCVELNSMPEVRNLRVKNDFQNLPDTTEILNELSQLLSSNVTQSIEDGRQAFNELGHRIKNEVEPLLPDIRIMINKTGEELKQVAESLCKALDSVPLDEGRKRLEDVEVEIKKYAPLRYYAVLGTCLTISFIFTLLTLGIFVGFCGRQPGSNYSNECCSRKTGSSFINCGIFFIFLTGGVLMAVAVVHFMLAGTLTQVICEAVYANDNRTQSALRLPTLEIDSDKFAYKFPAYHEIIRECQQGQSAYTAFQLSPVYNIEDIAHLSDRFKLKAKQLANQVSLPNDATANIVFLSPEAKQKLAQFSKSKITRVKFDSFAKQLEESIVSVDLREIINRLNETVEDEGNADIPREVKARLQNEILILESLQDKLLTPMISEVKVAAESLRFLAEQQKDLAQRIEGVAEVAEKVQQSLHSSGARHQVRQLAHEFEGEFVKHVEEYANFTYVSIRDQVGRCDPLYNSFNATTTTFCHKIGSPLSAFWFSLTSLILLFVPLLLVGMTLARLYRKYKYLGYESETYYSTYGDGDTIPLSLSANGRRQKRGRGGDSTPASGAQTPHSSTGAAASVAAHSRYQNRFEDTSQKAWGSQLVFNNHHTPPASGEYERPPPYYYPGPAN